MFRPFILTKYTLIIIETLTWKFNTVLPPQVCEMRVCEQQQMEEVRAALSVAGEPSPYSTDSLMAESLGMNSGTSSPTPDGQPSTHNDKMKLMRKMLKKKFAQPYSRVSPSKVGGSRHCWCYLMFLLFL